MKGVIRNRRQSTPVFLYDSTLEINLEVLEFGPLPLAFW